MRNGAIRTTQSPDDYVKQWEGSPWYSAIAEAHDLLTTFIPGYEPVQITERDGELCFNFVVSGDTPGDRGLYVQLARAIVADIGAKECAVEESEEEE